jgi:hypothetical protein
MSAAPAAWGDSASWKAITQAGLVALPVVAAWFVITLIVAFPMLSALRDTAYGLPGASFLGGSFGSSLDQLTQIGLGAIGSILAGLNVQVSANGATSGGSSSAIGTVGFAPILTLALFGVIVAKRSMSAAREHSGANLGDYLRPAALAAGITALALYVAALLLTSSIGGSLNSAIGSGQVDINYKGGPTFGGLLLTLFPTLLASAVIGALLGGGWPRLVEWVSAKSAAGRSQQVMTFVPLAGYALGGYVAALAVASVGGFVILVVWALINNVDLGAMLPYLPGMFALTPNAVAVLMLAGTGAEIGVATVVPGTSASNAAMVSLWNADLLWVLAGVAALVLPGLAAGIIARSRTNQATPSMVAIVGGFTGLLLLIGAVLAVPSFSASSVAGGGSYGISGSTKFLYDMGQAVLVGGILTVGSAIAGYRFGGGLAAPVAAQVDRLPRVE